MRTAIRIFIFFTIFSYSITGFSQQKSIDSLENALHQLEKNPASYHRDTTIVNLLYDLAWQIVNYTPDSIKASTYAQRALDLSEKINWDLGKAYSHDIIGRIYSIRKNYVSAIDQFSQAATLMMEMKNNDGLAKSFYNMGTAYQSQGNFPAALDYLLQALKKNEETGNVGDMGRDFNSIGDVYAAIDDQANALSYYQRALKSFETLKDKYWTAIALGNIAIIYNQQKEFVKALEYYFRVLKMEGNNSYSNYETFVQIGDVYRNISASILQNQTDTAWTKAYEYFSKAHQIATEIDDGYIAGLAMNGIGALFLEKKNWNEADKALHTAVTLLKASNSPEALKDCYFNLSRLDSAKGDWKNSLAHFRLYTIISDSLFNKKKSRLLAQTEINYETEKKQKQIQLKDLEIQQQAKNILLIVLSAVILLMIVGGFAYYRSKRTRQQSLKQISEAKLASLKSLMDKHFIFSSLHSIDTFLMNNNPEAASDYLVKYSKLIRSILEMSNQPEVSLEEEITLCKSYLDLEKIRFNHVFDYEISVDPYISPQQTIFPSMLLQPLVENAVKHGIGSRAGYNDIEKGKITITINKQNDRLVCVVSDNGRGLQFAGTKSKDHRSYSGKGIIERVKVYNNLRKNKASFVLKDNNPGVSATLTLPFILRKQSLTA
jgi:tetratricopeptide (TPR) repeat protein